ncbi:MAG: sulfatase-like hydrolase/transferase [Saccharofermentanales bacterium]
MESKKPNIVFVFADQWRASAAHYAGDPNVRTPTIDDLHERSTSFCNAVSNCPICTPYRASLLSGQYPLTTGIFANDLCLDPETDSFAKICKRNGYDTAYIGKWHIDGHGRSSFIPEERRQGFDYWKVLECTHDYNNSIYYSVTPELKKWDGYDTYAQTDDAIDYISGHDKENPFLLVVSYGTPHNPYETAPEDLIKSYDAESLVLPPNIDKSAEASARKDLCGYYAHITAIDGCVARIGKAIHDKGIDENTIFVLTSDHGDCVYSHTDAKVPNINKQRPFDESVLVPLMIDYPPVTKGMKTEIQTPICTPDILPTLLDLAGIEIPDCIEGISLAGEIAGKEAVRRDGVLIASYMPFADFGPARAAESYEYRGIRTREYTYVRDLNGAKMLFNNLEDKYQMKNIVDDPAYEKVKLKLDSELSSLLAGQNDDFLPALQLIEKYGFHDLTEDDFILNEKTEEWYVEQKRLIEINRNK